MATKKVLDASLTAVADAIRAKGETAADLTFPNGFVTAIQAIPTGGGDEWEEKFKAYLENDAAEFPDDTTELRTYALYGFPNLTEADIVALPDSLKILGAFCLGNNAHLTEIDLSGKSLVLLGENCFSNNARITKIDLSDNNLMTLGNQLMINCPALTTVDLSDNPNLKDIPNEFANGVLLNTIIVTNSPIETIGTSAFYTASSQKRAPLAWLEGVTTLKSIGDYAFYSKDSVNNYTLDLSNTVLETIGGNAFQSQPTSGYHGLTSIKFPATLQTIGNSAFSGNPLTTVDFSECTDLISIGSSAFYLGSGASYAIAELDFSQCSSLESFGTGMLWSSDTNRHPVKKLKLPSHKLVSIGESAFRNANLTEQGNVNNGELTVRTGSLGANSFLKCNGIVKLNLEFDSCGIAPFSQSTGLTEVHMLNTPTGPWPSNIRTYPVFYNCSNVTDIYVPWSQGAIAENYFFLAAQNPTWHYDTAY